MRHEPYSDALEPYIVTVEPYIVTVEPYIVTGNPPSPQRGKTIASTAALISSCPWAKGEEALWPPLMGAVPTWNLDICTGLFVILPR